MSPDPLASACKTILDNLERWQAEACQMALQEQDHEAYTESLYDNLAGVLAGLRSAAQLKERRRCAAVARREGRRLCRDTDSIQYRVAFHIAKEIERP